MPAGLWRPGIAGVADLYLSTPPPWNGRSDVRESEVPPTSTVDRRPTRSARRLPIMLVLPSAAGSDGHRAVDQYAQMLADRDAAVGLVKVCPDQIRTQVINAAQPNHDKADTTYVPWAADSWEPITTLGRDQNPRNGSGQNGHVFPAAGTETTDAQLKALIERVDCLLVAWMNDPSALPSGLAAPGVEVTVFVQPHEESRVEAYRNIKLAVHRWPEARLRLFVALTEDREKARIVSNRLHVLTEKHLDRTLRYEGLHTSASARERYQQTSCSTSEGPAFPTNQVELDRLTTIVRNHVTCDSRIEDPRLPLRGSSCETDVHATDRLALPLLGPLQSVEELDACLDQNRSCFTEAALYSSRLGHVGPQGVALRLLSDGNGSGTTILACAREPGMPVLATAMAATHAIDDRREIVLVIPTNDVARTTDAGSPVRVRTYGFEQIRLGRQFGLLLSPP